jgi:hypothetical protein
MPDQDATDRGRDYWRAPWRVPSAPRHRPPLPQIPSASPAEDEQPREQTALAHLSDRREAMAYLTRRTCGARNRSGGFCGLPPMRGKLRCKFHGGASVGRKLTEEEKIRQVANMRRGRQEKAARLRAAREAEASMPKRRGSLSARIDKAFLLPERLSPASMPAEIDQSDAAELRRATKLALRWLRQVLALDPLADDWDAERVRAITAAAQVVLSAQIKVDDSGFRERRRTDKLRLRPGASAELFRDTEDGDAAGAEGDEDADLTSGF